MAKEYWLKFGTGNPTTYAGLAPTLTIFSSWTGGALTAPGITQPIASYGLYRFEYTPSFSIIFVADGATTSLAATDRYLTGTLDPLDLADELIAQTNTNVVNSGSTLVAIGNTVSVIDFTSLAAVIGTTASSIGSTGVDPGDVMGFLKRLQEDQEGNSTFDKTTGVWQIETRGGTLLASKTLVNSASSVTKT